KVVDSVTGGTADQARSEERRVGKESKTGKMRLTGEDVGDQVESYGSSSVATGDSIAVGAYKTYTVTYTLTQADLDGKGGGDSKLDNTATADTNQTGSDSASASVELVYAPSFSISKVVDSVTGGTADQA